METLHLYCSGTKKNNSDLRSLYNAFQSFNLTSAEAVKKAGEDKLYVKISTDVWKNKHFLWGLSHKTRCALKEKFSLKFFLLGITGNNLVFFLLLSGNEPYYVLITSLFLMHALSASYLVANVAGWEGYFSPLSLLSLKR